MNIPKSISVKTTFAPGKRQRESTNPFIAPSIEEIMAPGMAISSVRPRAGLSSPHAADQPSRLNPLGRAQRLGLRACLLYTSDAADDLLCVDLGGRRIII